MYAVNTEAVQLDFVAPELHCGALYSRRVLRLVRPSMDLANDGYCRGGSPVLSVCKLRKA